MTTYKLLKLLCSQNKDDHKIAEEIIKQHPNYLLELTIVAHYAGASSGNPKVSVEFGGSRVLYNSLWKIYPINEAEMQLREILTKIKKDDAEQRELQG